MNQRIRQFAEQASHQSPDGYPVTIPYSKDFAKKFAELIVRECAMFVEVELEGQVGSLIADRTANRLEEHFGVEQSG
jgi:hypothetical protein